MTSNKLLTADYTYTHWTDKPTQTLCPTLP